jgi:hypothetical protein
MVSFHSLITIYSIYMSRGGYSVTHHVVTNMLIQPGVKPGLHVHQRYTNGGSTRVKNGARRRKQMDLQLDRDRDPQRRSNRSHQRRSKRSNIRAAAMMIVSGMYQCMYIPSFTLRSCMYRRGIRRLIRADIDQAIKRKDTGIYVTTM